MKKHILYICTFILFVVSQHNSYSQCEPDTVHCKDTLLPGEICPLILPDGIINEPYEKVFTVIPPSKYYSLIDTLEIIKIVVDNVGNLPPGLSYVANSDTFYADTSYCILLTGIPTKPGTYNLRISVIPFIYFELFKMVIQDKARIDSTSLSITIREQTGIYDFSGKDFSIIDASPNPFRNTTRIGFYTQTGEMIELRIYNLLGQLVYNERNTYRPGRNYFDFNGLNLQAGTYLYNISCTDKSFTRKLIRLE